MKKKTNNKTLGINAITPFDKENKENFSSMDFKFDVKREIEIADDEIGKRRFVK